MPKKIKRNKGMMMNIFKVTPKLIVLTFTLSITLINHSLAAEVDIAINNVLVIDGLGSKGYKANVFIVKDKIYQIDKTQTLKHTAKKTINAENKVLSPGFIDLHSHGSAIKNGSFENFISMGVTTITLGQDGFSPNTDDLSMWKNDVSVRGTKPNIVMFFGHSTLRNLVGIGQVSDITAQQQSEMEHILKRNLPHIYGLSTGLEYSPALYAKPQEIIELAKIMGQHDKLIMSHLRNEDDHELNNSIAELLAQGEYARVHIAHLKSVYGKGSTRAEEILQLLYKAQQSGINITADVYPYTASYTGIAIVFPDWAKTPDQLSDALPERREELEAFIINKINSRNGPEATVFGNEPYQGKTLAQVALALNKPFQQVLIDDIGPDGMSAAYFVMNQELQWRLISDPLIGISSDGSPTGFHPRGHGTFSKIIEEFVFKDKMFTLEQAIHKLTMKPASILNLQNRGSIEVGNFADLLIFEPKNIKSKASYISPHKLSEGFDYVLVNGEISLQNGEFSTKRTGKVL